MFRRRDPRSYSRIAREAFWPRGGWARAASYVKHRLRRLPDPPRRVARGLAAGVFVSFTPLFGLHFLVAALLARLVRGNILASLLGTFFGNPLTFPFIAWSSLEFGSFLLGTTRGVRAHGSVWEAFTGAWGDLWFNLRAAVTPAEMRWGGLDVFWADVFVPYAVGGVAPGLAAAALAYGLTVPIVTAYQKRRAGLAARKLERLRAKAKREAGRDGVAG